MNLQEQHAKAHLEAFEDVMRLVRQLAGWGQYDSYIKNPESVFDHYWPMSIEELHAERERLGAESTKYVLSLHPVETIYRELREDEMDTDDPDENPYPTF